jgi:hypothetical protein
MCQDLLHTSYLDSQDCVPSNNNSYFLNIRYATCCQTLKNFVLLIVYVVSVVSIMELFKTFFRFSSPQSGSDRKEACQSPDRRPLSARLRSGAAAPLPAAVAPAAAAIRCWPAASHSRDKKKWRHRRFSKCF